VVKDAKALIHPLTWFVDNRSHSAMRVLRCEKSMRVKSTHSYTSLKYLDKLCLTPYEQRNVRPSIHAFDTVNEADKPEDLHNQQTAFAQEVQRVQP
jgi:hypothetical protein